MKKQLVSAAVKVGRSIISEPALTMQKRSTRGARARVFVCVCMRARAFLRMIQYASITASFSLLFQAFHIKHTISTAKYNKSHRLLFNTLKNITVTGDRGSFFNYDPIIRPPATDVCLYFVQLQVVFFGKFISDQV